MLAIVRQGRHGSTRRMPWKTTTSPVRATTWRLVHVKLRTGPQNASSIKTRNVPLPYTLFICFRGGHLSPTPCLFVRLDGRCNVGDIYLRTSEAKAIGLDCKLDAVDLNPAPAPASPTAKPTHETLMTITLGLAKKDFTKENQVCKTLVSVLLKICVILLVTPVCVEYRSYIEWSLPKSQVSRLMMSALRVLHR